MPLKKDTGCTRDIACHIHLMKSGALCGQADV